MKITVQLFGAFRALGDRLELELAEDSTITQVRSAVKDKVDGMELDELLVLSKFANAREVLADSYHCQPDDILAILPPVSGG